MAVCSSYNIPFPVVSYIRTIWSKYESPQNRFFFVLIYYIENYYFNFFDFISIRANFLKGTRNTIHMA